MIESPLLMRLGVAASIVGHIAVVILGLLYADAQPFAPRPSEAVSVDIVRPDEVEVPPPKPADEPKPVETKPDPLDFSALTAPDKAQITPLPGQQAPQPKSQAPTAPSRTAAPPGSPQTAPPQQAPKPAGPDAAQPTPAAPIPPPPSAQAAPVPPAPEPDITVKYGVMLGLPALNQNDGVDAPAFEAAKVAVDDIAAFRSHLKSCSSLPPGIAPTDKVRIVLRITLTRDGRLAAEPSLIEASASVKGPALMQNAVRALQTCQPYAMLPPDKYSEWKMLDLAFTPQDFGGG
jgi:hypothetical protein